MLHAPSLLVTFGSEAVIFPSNVALGPAWSSMVKQAALMLLVSDGGRGSVQMAHNAGGDAMACVPSTASRSNVTAAPSAASGGLPRMARMRGTFASEI